MAKRKRGEILKRCRLQANMTQSELAERLGTDKTVVSRWEHGLAPSKRMAVKLAEFTGTPVEVWR